MPGYRGQILQGSDFGVVDLLQLGNIPLQTGLPANIVGYWRTKVVFYIICAQDVNKYVRQCYCAYSIMPFKSFSAEKRQGHFVLNWSNAQGQDRAINYG